MTYYKSNAIYAALINTANHPFVWVAGNAWTLIYGDQDGIPRVLVLAGGISWVRQKEVIAAFRTIASKSGLPLVFIRFDDTAASIDDVIFGRPGQTPVRISLDELRNEFGRMGLPVGKGACGKSVNDATSSAYHNWQRASLGTIKVTDIDLIRLDDAGTPIEAIELKRSYISLADWQPFQADYANFNLLLSVCQMSGMDLSIAYNVRQTRPVFIDDVSSMSIFDYRGRNSPVRNKELTFPDFVARNY